MNEIDLLSHVYQTAEMGQDGITSVLKRSRDRERLRTHILLARLLASQGLEAALAVPAGGTV